MAIDPKARNVTLSYEGGTITGSLGLIQYVFGEQTLSWDITGLPPSAPGGNSRRKYGSRQRSAAAGGKVMFLRLNTGDAWTVRYTGTAIKFIDAVLSKSIRGRVIQAWTTRGTLYGPQIGELV